PDYITNVRRALTDLPLVATGNIDLEEIPDYFTAGVVGFGGGGPLIPPDLLQRGDLASVIHNAERFLAATRRPATNQAVPRDLPLGNGDFLVNFDARYHLRDVFYP